jgi:hypothetical protein
MLVERIQANDLDLAIITHVETRGPAEVIREERLLWVTSQRHSAQDETPIPLALGRPTCNWRQAATERLDVIGRPLSHPLCELELERRGSGGDGGACGLGPARERHPHRYAHPRAAGRLPGAAIVQDRPHAQPA